MEVNMKIAKVVEVNAFRFYISENFYCQCEIELSDIDEEVEALYSMSCTDNGVIESLEYQNYERTNFLENKMDIMEKEISKILSDINLWNDVIAPMFNSRRDFHLFAAEYESCFVNINSVDDCEEKPNE